MSNVIIDREKIDILANAISDKSGVPVMMTLDEMVEAVDSIEVGGGGITPTGNINITQSGVTDVTNYVTATIPILTPEQLDIGFGYDYVTESGQRKWKIDPYCQNVSDSGGMMDAYARYGENSIVFNAVSSNTSITPTESSQTIGGANYMMEGAVTVNAIPSNYVGSGITQRSSSDLTASGATVTVPSGYYSAQASKAVTSGTAGTPTATKGSVSNHQVSVTPSVTNTTGYITGSTKTGTAVTVSASELVSGTYTVDSSGTKNVTNYASVSVPAMTLPIAPGQSSSGTKKGTITTSLNTQYLNINTGFNDSAQYYEVAPMVLDSKTITENGTYLAYMENLDGYNSVTVNVSGGGGSSMQIGKLDGEATSTSSISFTGLQGEPTAFSFMIDASVATGTPSKIVAVVFDGTSLHAQTITNTANAQVTYDSTSLSKTYSNGTLTITSNGPSFVLDYYYGVYTYSGGAVDTKDVQVGSGATSITFTGLEDEPAWWSCIFKSNFSTSSGYQRVIYVAKGNTTTNVSGLEMDSGAHNTVHWTASYNNGSFTITSQGTNAGGYFHQPGYYQLTYAYDNGSGEASSITTEPLSVTTNGTYTAPNGKAYTPVYVNVSEANIDTKTLTNSTATVTSLQFTSMLGQPKAFFLRLTAQIARSSSYRYYYVENVRYNGTNTNGRYFYQYNGTLYNDTTHYSYSYSGTTLTISSTGSQSGAGGSFYNGAYELVYIY